MCDVLLESFNVSSVNEGFKDKAKAIFTKIIDGIKEIIKKISLVIAALKDTRYTKLLNIVKEAAKTNPDIYDKVEFTAKPYLNNLEVKSKVDWMKAASKRGSLGDLELPEDMSSNLYLYIISTLNGALMLSEKEYMENESGGGTNCRVSLTTNVNFAMKKGESKITAAEFLKTTSCDGNNPNVNRKVVDELTAACDNISKKVKGIDSDDEVYIKRFNKALEALGNAAALSLNDYSNHITMTTAMVKYIKGGKL